MASLSFLFVPEGRRSLLGVQARGGDNPNGAPSPPCLSTPLIVGAEVILCKNHTGDIWVEVRVCPGRGGGGQGGGRQVDRQAGDTLLRPFCSPFLPSISSFCHQVAGRGGGVGVVLCCASSTLLSLSFIRLASR